MELVRDMGMVVDFTIEELPDSGIFIIDDLEDYLLLLNGDTFVLINNDNEVLRYKSLGEFKSQLTDWDIVIDFTRFTNIEIKKIVYEVV